MTLSDLQQQWRGSRDPDPVLAASPAWLDRASDLLSDPKPGCLNDSDCADSGFSTELL